MTQRSHLYAGLTGFRVTLSFRKPSGALFQIERPSFHSEQGNAYRHKPDK
jgi:hypothetical protein